MRGVVRPRGGQPAPSRAERSGVLGWVQVAPVKAFTSVCYREGIIFQRERTSYTRHKLRASKMRYIFHLCELVTTQVAPDSESTCGTAVCVVSFNTNLSNLTNRAG